MKKALQLICIVAVMTIPAGCKSKGLPDDKNQYTIRCTIDDASLEGEMVYLLNSDNTEMPVDSAQISNGGFVMKGSVDEPWAAFLVSESNSFSTPIIVEKGTIVVTTENIGGTLLNDRMQSFRNSLDLNNLEAQMEEYIDLYHNASTTPERAKAEHILDSLQNVANTLTLEKCWIFYHENPDNILGVIALESICQVGDLTYTELDSIVKAATPQVAKSKKIQAKLAQLHHIDATAVGKHYTDIQGQVSTEKGQYRNGRLSDLIDGKLALVDFYASWCGPCRNEIKDNLVPLWEKYKDKGLVIVGLNVWERGDAEARKAAHEKVMAELGITYPQLVDSTRTATDTYGVNGIPQIMLIDKDGTILARDLRGEAIEEAIKEALKK